MQGKKWLKDGAANTNWFFQSPESRGSRISPKECKCGVTGELANILSEDENVVEENKLVLQVQKIVLTYAMSQFINFIGASNWKLRTKK